MDNIIRAQKRCIFEEDSSEEMSKMLNSLSYWNSREVTKHLKSASRNQGSLEYMGSWYL